MDIRTVTQENAEAYAGAVADLVYATGPISYQYQFLNRAIFDAVVTQSWLTADTLFGHDIADIALVDGELAGMMLSFHAPEFRTRGQALAPIFMSMLETGDLSAEEFGQILENVEHAHWLNPETRPGKYYIHAVTTDPSYRRQGVGQALLAKAQIKAQQQGCSHIELDVLSDNPAVGLYQSLGYEVLAETKAPKPYAFGVPVEYRMAKKID